MTTRNEGKCFQFNVKGGKRQDTKLHDFADCICIKPDMHMKNKSGMTCKNDIRF